MPDVRSRFRNAWNAFFDRDQNDRASVAEFGQCVSSIRPDRPRFTRGNERSMVNAVYNRIAMDVAAVTINHVRLDENGRFKEVIQSGLNNCLTVDANRDQTGRAFIQDVVMSMLDEGAVAIVPTDTALDPMRNTSFDILEMRTGKILSWYPDKVLLEVFNEQTGRHEEIIMPKRAVAIIENPLYAVMNEKSSTLQRLIRKLNLLDVVDEQSSSGKLDLIVQLPYVVRTKAREEQADARRKSIEQQLAGSKYGIAYVDSAEKITQLNRSIDNNLLTQVQYLTQLFYSQLGISETVMNGTASEQEMLNYNNRTIEPIISAITDEIKRKFLTKTARSQGQSVMFFKEPFKLVPVSQIAEIADKFTRNQIMSANEMRQVIGMKPVADPIADQLRNANISASPDQHFASVENQQDSTGESYDPDAGQNQNGYNVSSDSDNYQRVAEIMSMSYTDFTQEE